MNIHNIKRSESDRINEDSINLCNPSNFAQDLVRDLKFRYKAILLPHFSFTGLFIAHIRTQPQ